MDIEGKSALVTGGASGIGLACVKELLRAGAEHVAIVDIDEVTAVQVLNDLNGEFGAERVIYIKTDVTKPAELENAFKESITTFKYLDIVINQAGLVDEVTWEREIATDFEAQVRSTILALKYMGKNTGGRGGFLCNTASILSFFPCTSFPVYSAAKHGVLGLSRSFGQPFHFERTGVRVVAMCPGLTETPMILDVHLKLMDVGWSAQLGQEISLFKTQKPENVAKGMMTLIREASSGSVWVCEEELPVYEVDIPHYKLNKKE